MHQQPVHPSRHTAACPCLREGCEWYIVYVKVVRAGSFRREVFSESNKVDVRDKSIINGKFREYVRVMEREVI